jgi:ABC-type polysaccharide/polyol phosphate transport system ATPase subunit
LLSNIEVINVLKLFTIRHNQADSLKSKFIGIVHKRYREQRETLWALRHVSFDVFPGEAFGLGGKKWLGQEHNAWSHRWYLSADQIHLPM